NLSWNRLDTSISGGTLTFGSPTPKSEIWTTDETTGAIKLAVSQSLDLNNQDMKNVRSILSASGKWSISEEGILTVEEFKARKICFGDQCLDSYELKSLLEMKAELIKSDIYKVKSTTPVVEPSGLQSDVPVVDESVNDTTNEQPTTTAPTNEEESETPPEPITEPTPPSEPEPEPTPSPEPVPEPEPVIEPTPEPEAEIIPNDSVK
ncbi:MAG: hypothetical protein UT05_C0001G0125, partial [Parcubacteria group bacterium GW2011_GWF2_38_76]